MGARSVGIGQHDTPPSVRRQMVTDCGDELHMPIVG
jgi:hypothetical protein